MASDMQAAAAGSPLLAVRGLGKSFGGIQAVRNISFDVRKGEILGLIGPNGAGKTTCFNLITGFYSPSSGTVLLGGEDVTGAAPYAMAAKGIVRSFQKTNVLKPLSVFENVLSAHYLLARQSLWATFFPGRQVRQAEERVRASATEIVQVMGLENRLNSPAYLLSCGELRLLEVGVALAAHPRVLMLDEPAAGLNTEEAEAFGRTLRRLRDDGRVEAILIVEHNMALVMGISDRVVVMNFGAKLAEGRPDAVQSDPVVIEAYLGRETEQ